MPQWRNETNVEVNLDAEEGSLFASLFYMVAAISNPIGGILAGAYGRRKTVILMAPLEAIGWLLIGFAQNKLMLYFGRIISSGTYSLTLPYFTLPYSTKLYPTMPFCTLFYSIHYISEHM